MASFRVTTIASVRGMAIIRVNVRDACDIDRAGLFGKADTLVSVT